ncbi:MAG TPA: transglycosylase domain-containing protein [Jatrophihabitans sp.]|nr:transglycosylase domain-containing protein [Jatrophihabitans sp.]
MPAHRPEPDGATATRGPAAVLAWWRRRHALKKRRLARMSRRKRILRRVGLVLTWLLGLFALLVTVLAIGVYSVAHVPSPDELHTNQTAVLQYADGSTMATIDNGENRTDVSLSAVPQYVQDAVLAAEDRGFYSEPGISIRGTLRAAINDIRGGSTQGGSTITQQYVKNAYLNSDQSLSRKLKELAISLKLSREYSKDTILENYLNTIYFGRQAYGVEAAAKAYFGVDVGKLTVAQGALLAAVIKSPEYYDPALTPSAARGRWNYVVDGMVSTGKLSQAERDKLKFPTTIKTRSVSSVLDGPLGLVWRQVKAELSADGIDPASINTKGLRIQTSIDKTAQASAEAAVRQVYGHLTAKQKNLRPALAAVNPATGAVLAYYGGSSGTGLDYVQAWRPPGSSFKPYVTATALTQNLRGVKPAYTVQSVFDGSSPTTIDGLPFANDPTDPSSGSYTLLNATTLSLNTVFGKLASLVGPANVVSTARAMGIPDTESATGPNPGAPTLMRNGHPDAYVGIGNYPVRILDQAVGYATLADGGEFRSSYFIQKVTDSHGNVLYQHHDHAKRVLDGRVANDVTLSMERVADTSGIGLNGDRPVAAKTGTVGIQDTGDSSDGWTVGFTPQVSAASWVGSDKVEPIYDANGNSEYGRDLAGHTWKLFMDGYLAGKPVAALATKQEVGLPTPSPVTSSAASSSSATPTPTPTPTKTSTPPSSTAASSSSATPSCTPPGILVGGVCVTNPVSSSPPPSSSAAGTATPAPTT